MLGRTLLCLTMVDYVASALIATDDDDDQRFEA